MGAASLTCDRCRARLPVAALNTPDFVACPVCSTPLRFLVFPAYYRAHAPTQAGESLMVEGESSCFYHAAKKAVVPCDGCGRFLCALCDVELDARHLCPRCLEAAQTKGTMDTLERERYLYDSVALYLAVGSLLLMFCMPYISVFMAPAAIYVGIRHWNKPQSFQSTAKTKNVIAILLASLVLLMGATFILFMIAAIVSSQ